MQDPGNKPLKPKLLGTSVFSVPPLASVAHLPSPSKVARQDIPRGVAPACVGPTRRRAGRTCFRRLLLQPLYRSLSKGRRRLPRPPAATITAAPPASTATKNAILPPTLSAMSPAVHAPTAAPTPSAVIVQLRPSVSAPEGTSFWTRVKPAMSVGAIATPARIEAGAMSATLGARTSGSVPTHSTTTDATKRLSSGQRQLCVPYARPAKRLPAAMSASSGPAAAGVPI